MTLHCCTISERVHWFWWQCGAAASQREVFLVRDELRGADKRAGEDLGFRRRAASLLPRSCAFVLPLHIAQFYSLAQISNCNVLDFNIPSYEAF